MSNHPFGLRGDPFVPPATLSAKDASRLIRRRVRACDGDGGLLYPIDTCDAIHRLAHGVPDAVLALAGRALAVAAAAGARAVSPAHVKQAAEGGIATAPSQPRAAAQTESRPAALAPRGGKPAVATTGSVTPRAPAEKRAAAERGATAASEPEETPAATEPPYEPVSEPAAEPMVALDDLDDDLPPFQPASVALPTKPSEDLPEEAREWVSRFIPSQTPIAPLIEGELPRGTHARAPSDVPAPVAAARPSPRPEPVVEALHAAASPSRAARPRPRPRQRRRNPNRTLVAVLGVVAVLAVVLRYSTPEHLAAPDSESSHPVHTSAPGVEPSAPAPPPAVTVSPLERQASPPTASGEAQSAAEPARERPDSAGSTGSEPRIAPTEPARPAPVPSRFALEVASFIFEERARQERDRLAAVGLHARVVTTLEFGSRVYRVVIGGYPQPAAAERAADSLLSNGVVLQARVITTGGAR